jgi:colanic acid/amylovoran biosynthesis glycosyltransferase
VSAGGRLTVLYVVTRFPAVTETFVVNEWLALSERFRMQLVALRRGREPAVHPETARVRPLAAFPALFAVLRGALRFSVVEAAKEAVVFAKAAAIARTAARDGVDRVHAHFASHPATAAWVVHRLTGIPFSFTAHANDLFVAPVLLDRKLADARAVVAISEYNRHLLLERAPPARVELIHCGVDLERRPRARRASGERIVCVASLLPKKGHLDLIDALALLAQRRPGVSLELVGEGPERERIEARARERGVAANVTLRGALPSDGVREALGRASAFALPSVRLASGRMEGIPVALMEAMAAGVPVVSTRLSGIPELVRDGVTGLLVEPHDAPALAAALERLLADEDLAQSLATAARALVERSFSLQVEARRLGDLLAEP